MKSDWTKNIKGSEEQEIFRQRVFSSREVLDRLNGLLKEWGGQLDKSETDPTVFETPNWAYLQAYKNGYRAALNKMEQLITLDQ